MRVVWKHLPLTSIHPFAMGAALASEAARNQGKFWEFHDKLFKNQPKIQRPFLLQYAQELGLDMKRFEHSLEIEQAKPLIDADEAEAKALGVTGTPAFFVNGHFLSGAKPFEEFAQSINAELTKLNVPVPPAAAKAGG